MACALDLAYEAACIRPSQASKNNISESEEVAACIPQVAFAFDAVAATAVCSIRKRAPAAAGQLPPRDILLLHPTGRLSLYIGSRYVCNVAVPGQMSDAAKLYAPFSGRCSRSILHSSGLCHVPKVAAGL
jgi:hypothetical protein